LKSQLAAFANDTKSSEQSLKLQKKINQLKQREDELCHQLLSLKSKLENEKCENESKEILLQHRADHIRTLQDAENVSNARIFLQIREIEELRNEFKNFEKFKLAHEEERVHFNKVFNSNFKMGK
jgi:formate-dependent nitrite reductase cytochrome c552 subunit